MKYILIILLSAINMSAFSNDSMPQKALDAFVRIYWNDKLFIDEGTRLKFNNSLPLHVLIDKKTTRKLITELSYYGLSENKTNEQIEKNKLEILSNQKINYSKYKLFTLPIRTMINSDHDKIKAIRSDSNLKNKGYIVRISVPIKFDKFIIKEREQGLYIVDIWVKGTAPSWGRHIQFIFDKGFKLIDHSYHQVYHESG